MPFFRNSIREIRKVDPNFNPRTDINWFSILYFLENYSGPNDKGIRMDLLPEIDSRGPELSYLVGTNFQDYDLTDAQQSEQAARLIQYYMFEALSTTTSSINVAPNMDLVTLLRYSPIYLQELLQHFCCH